MEFSMIYSLPCSLSSCFVILFSTVITSLGEEGAGLCASRAFVCLFCTCYFFFFFFCHFSLLLVSGVGCGLWLWHSLDFSVNFFYTHSSPGDSNSFIETNMSELWNWKANKFPTWFKKPLIYALVSNTNEPRHQKTCLCHMRTTKVQISLRIHAVWSAPLLFAA